MYYQRILKETENRTKKNINDRCNITENRAKTNRNAIYNLSKKDKNKLKKNEKQFPVKTEEENESGKVKRRKPAQINLSKLFLLKFN